MVWVPRKRLLSVDRKPGLIPMEVNTNHPHLRGCTIFYPLLEGRGTVTRDVMRNVESTIAGGTWRYRFANGGQTALDAAMINAGTHALGLDWTAMIYAWYDNMNSDQAIINGYTGSDQLPIIWFDRTGTNVGRAGYASPSAVYGSSLTLAAHGNRELVWGASKNTSTVFFYADGKAHGSAAYAADADTSRTIRFGANNSGTKRNQADTYQFRLYERVLSADEWMEIHLNPNAPLQEWRRHSFPVGAGGGASASVTLDGVLGTGSVGTLTVAAIQNVSLSLTGAAGTGTAGDLSVSVACTVALVGVEGTGAIGTLSVDTGGNVDVTLDGIQGLGSAGDLTAAGVQTVTITVTGVQAEGQVGTLTITAAGTSIWTDLTATSVTWTPETPETTTWN